MPGEGTGVEAVRYARCFHHRTREAAARCPMCKRTYCRECITEHRGRVLCAACLQSAAAGRARSRVTRRALAVMAVAAGWAAAWFFFHGLGQVLIRIPTPFHDGTVWRADAEESAP